MREFVRLTETKNYTRTAEELYIAQPALSRHIAALEEELGCQLINRSRTTFELTPAGEIVRDRFQKILGEYQGMLAQLSRLAEDEAGEVRVGVLYYDYDCYVAGIRETFHERYPEVRLILRSYQPFQLERDLLDGVIDVALVYSVERLEREDVLTMPFLKLPLTLMFDRAHRLAKLSEIHVTDLEGEGILMPEKTMELNQTGRIVRQLFTRNGVRMGRELPVSNFDEVPYLLRDSQAIYIAPMANTRAYHEGTECRYLESETCATDISAVWLKASQNPAIKLFLSAIRICYP